MNYYLETYGCQMNKAESAASGGHAARAFVDARRRAISPISYS